MASTGQSLMQCSGWPSRRRSRVGSAPAFAEVKDSSDDLLRRVQGLGSGDEMLKLERVGGQYAPNSKNQPLAETCRQECQAILRSNRS